MGELFVLSNQTIFAPNLIITSPGLGIWVVLGQVGQMFVWSNQTPLISTKLTDAHFLSEILPTFNFSEFSSDFLKRCQRRTNCFADNHSDGKGQMVGWFLRWSDDLKWTRIDRMQSHHVHTHSLNIAHNSIIIVISSSSLGNPE